MKDIFTPLVAGLVSAFVIHLLTVSRTQRGLALELRIKAYSNFHQALIQLLRYTKARLAEERGADFEETVEDLSPEEKVSFMEHRCRIIRLHEEYFFLLPKPVRNNLDQLKARINLLSGHDLRCALDDSAPINSTSSCLENLIESIENSLKILYDNSPVK